MLFNSHVFIFAFLPITLAGFFLLGRRRLGGAARLWLLAASLVFYGWWSLPFLALLLASIGVQLRRLAAPIAASRAGRPRLACG